MSTATALQPYFQRNRAKLYVGDVLAVLEKMPPESVHCAITSPPYWGLRDYGTASWDGGDAECDHLRPPMGGQGRETLVGTTAAGNGTRMQHYRDTCGKCGAHRIDQQIGLEATPGEYVERMVEVFGELRRVLRNDGTLWLNLGSSYAGKATAGQTDDVMGWIGDKKFGNGERGRGAITPGFKPKDLVPIPWMVAMALQADGWYLRSDIIWAKPNPMPESVTDRPTKSHEHVFLLSKASTYYYDQEAVREKSIRPEDAKLANNGIGLHGGKAWNVGSTRVYGEDPTRRNLRDVWTIATQPTPEAHFATFPEALVEPCIKAGTSERGVCPVCGAPWRRVVESPFKGDGNPIGYGDRLTKGNKMRMSGKELAQWNAINPAQHLGWQPTCTHDAEPIPAVCLDPFAGSGTVLLVAQRLGRYGVGIELNREYADIAARRLAQEVLDL